ncbi:MAG: 3-hydroxyacyl-CoA dehydrogenase NAD-binding domain-containing protein [Saprospiraceae bacterium]
MLKIGVIGSGSMGSGIAQVAATAGHEVLLYDNNPTALERAQDKLQKILNRLVEKGRMDDPTAKAIFGRIYFVDNMLAFTDAGLIIEAIVEDLSVKKSVFGQLEDITNDQCILATNTSSLSVTAIASACGKPERVLGIHFFNPAPLMKLVEIVPAIQTDPAIVEQCRLLIESWGKLVVIAKDTPGFIVNRVARPFYGEALRIYEEGIADVATIDWAMTEIGGFRMGPFTLMDFIGNDVNYKVTETVFAAFYYDPRYRPAFTKSASPRQVGWEKNRKGLL